jgi:hypothetical protein
MSCRGCGFAVGVTGIKPLVELSVSTVPCLSFQVTEGIPGLNGVFLRNDYYRGKKLQRYYINLKHGKCFERGKVFRRVNPL